MLSGTGRRTDFDELFRPMPNGAWRPSVANHMGSRRGGWRALPQRASALSGASSTRCS